MERTLLPALVLAVVVAAFASPAGASFSRVPVEDLLRSADLVATGTVVEVTDGRAFSHWDVKAGGDVMVARIELAEVLKDSGDRSARPEVPRSCYVAFAKPGTAPNVLPREVGEEGVWLLSYDKARKLYRAGHPGCLQPLGEVDKIRKVLGRQGLQATLTVDLEQETPAGGRNRAATLLLRNTGRSAVTVTHPANPMAAALLVTDDRGNPVPRASRGKAEAVDRGDVTLQPGEAVTHTFEHLEFTTGTGLFAYEPEAGQAYRLIGVYRPDGKDGPGVCSQEVLATAR